MLTLLRRSFGRAARSFFSVAAILAGFQAAVIASAAAIAPGSFEQLAGSLPDFVRAGLGPALLSFAGMTTLGYWDPPIRLMIVVFAIYIASEPAGDVETGLVDLILARPLPRHWLVARSLILMTVVLALVIGIMGARTRASLRLWAPDAAAWPETGMVLLMMIHLGILGWCFGCMALAAAAAMKRRASAIGAVSLVAVSLFLLDILAEFSARFSTFGWLTPFHYFHGSEILRGAADTALNMTVLGGLGAIAAAGAFWQFSRRDL